MGLTIFQRRRILKNANYLELIPVRTQTFETGEDGQITLLVPKFKSKTLSYFIIPQSKSDHFRINFDQLGSATWQMIDGKMNVGKICTALSERLGEKIHPAEERVTKFLTLLYEQRYITFTELLEAETRR
ncbi:MAG: PqqD family protein [Bacteroidales bacterium]|nr:PqqD family protein [Bacteroidales bacterium]MDZ4203369.1 PqqD family protein [Bacteroidales bacterium]